MGCQDVRLAEVVMLLIMTTATNLCWRTSAVRVARRAPHAAHAKEIATAMPIAPRVRSAFSVAQANWCQDVRLAEVVMLLIMTTATNLCWRTSAVRVARRAPHAAH